MHDHLASAQHCAIHNSQGLLHLQQSKMERVIACSSMLLSLTHHALAYSTAPDNHPYCCSIKMADHSGVNSQTDAELQGVCTHVFYKGYLGPYEVVPLPTCRDHHCAAAASLSNMLHQHTGAAQVVRVQQCPHVL